MLIGYARTSTTDRGAGLDAQTRDLKAFGCEKLFSEQVSSVARRDQLAAALAFARDGDALVVTKADRLARNIMELLSIESELTRRGVGLVIRSMGGEQLDTRNPTSKLMLTILGGVATWKREMMLERQREGIAKAKSIPGKYKGRKATVAAQAERIRTLHTAGEAPTTIARRLGIGRSSVYRMLGNAAAAVRRASAGSPATPP